MANNDRSRGAALALRLRHGRRQAERAPRPGARDLPLVTGVTQNCQFFEPMENVLANAGEIVAASGRVFRYGSDVVMETGEGSERRLVTIAGDGCVEKAASSRLANVFICETGSTSGEGDPIQFPPPKGFVELLVNHEPFTATFSRIESYATRPVFDEQFVFRGPGWHPDVGVLVHGPDVEPDFDWNVSHEGPALQRLPPHLQRLLSDFCFRSDADVANAVGALVTGMVPSTFRESGKGVLLIDGNQPEVGKTWLARSIGVVLDGMDPRLTGYTPDDDELGKRICATLRGNSLQSILLLDNAKTKAGTAINSAVIEANSMAPDISIRILGQSINFVRPNDLLWAITMNDTRTSPDLVSRGLPVRLSYDGEPTQRDFGARDPICYAHQHRVELLGELAGMVVRWNQAGRPRHGHRHRCREWAGVVGGILHANGLPMFLANLSEAAGEFNTALDELAAVAEAAVALGIAVRIVANSALEERT